MNSLASLDPYVVIAEDNPLILMDVVDILGHVGFRTLEAVNGFSALELVLERCQDVALLLTDIEMPGSLDGIELSNRIAKMCQNIAIVVMSAHVRPGPGCLPDRARFLEKPFTPSKIYHTLAELLPIDRQPPGLITHYRSKVSRGS